MIAGFTYCQLTALCAALNLLAFVVVILIWERRDRRRLVRPIANARAYLTTTSKGDRAPGDKMELRRHLVAVLRAIDGKPELPSPFPYYVPRSESDGAK